MSLPFPPRLLIGATGSGVGKTSITLGLLRALKRRGLTVQPFKVGPDYLDPGYLSRAAGRTCINLDAWMMGADAVRQSFARHSAGADLAVIEGVMGLFDGANATDLAGSSAEVARLLSAPVLLTVHSHGVAGSLAATVQGFANFEEGVTIGGVIANRCGSARHLDILSDALTSRDLPPLLGGIARDSLPNLESRHLGLKSADRDSLPDSTLEALADAVEDQLDLDRLLQIARSAPPQSTPDLTPSAQPEASTSVRIGVARDEAFHFYYPDNLQALMDAGAELVEFSPIHDGTLPARLDGLYLGGGYPEAHGKALSKNQCMLDSIRAFAAAGHPIYAECGGLVYLSRELEMANGDAIPLLGLLPFATRMLPKRKALGYGEVTTKRGSLWGPAGTVLRGHEFHYSEIVHCPPEAALPRLYSVQHRRRTEPTREGFTTGSILASYMHLHWASHPACAENFVAACRIHKEQPLEERK